MFSSVDSPIKCSPAFSWFGPCVQYRCLEDVLLQEKRDNEKQDYLLVSLFSCQDGTTGTLSSAQGQEVTSPASLLGFYQCQQAKRARAKKPTVNNLCSSTRQINPIEMYWEIASKPSLRHAAYDQCHRKLTIINISYVTEL